MFSACRFRLPLGPHRRAAYLPSSPQLPLPLQAPAGQFRGYPGRARLAAALASLRMPGRHPGQQTRNPLAGFWLRLPAERTRGQELKWSCRCWERRGGEWWRGAAATLSLLPKATQDAPSSKPKDDHLHNWNDLSTVLLKLECGSEARGGLVETQFPHSSVGPFACLTFSQGKQVLLTWIPHVANLRSKEKIYIFGIKRGKFSLPFSLFLGFHITLPLHLTATPA